MEELIGKETFHDRSKFVTTMQQPHWSIKIMWIICGYIAHLLTFFQKELRLIWAIQSAQKLFIFIVIFYTFFIIEGLYGFFNNNLALISLAFYTSANALALLINLVAMIGNKHQPTRGYTYGFTRIEVVMTFTDGVFHLISAGFFNY